MKTEREGEREGEGEGERERERDKETLPAMLPMPPDMASVEPQLNPYLFEGVGLRV